MEINNNGFALKGHKVGNDYYIFENEAGNYNVYQDLHEINEGTTVLEIKEILPHLKQISDEEVIIQYRNEPVFLLLHNINIQEMNIFRLSLENEIIIRKKNVD
ncbi:hypothetical protein [Paenibacillus sp. VTT E-133291]|uniref:hypothetical protein n=1 Tax=Paenibacillus sp. VTT E-133291 TaxID=1986223 RepID=UPI000BA158D8|nr:hypothetical protein [Paenibacillus sp. VTT E-133291]OZQ97358.1 hypothetical protein CA598_06080 [Paenibacillus sp. VTT E-133291]